MSRNIRNWKTQITRLCFHFCLFLFEFLLCLDLDTYWLPGQCNKYSAINWMHFVGPGQLLFLHSQFNPTTFCNYVGTKLWLMTQNVYSAILQLYKPNTWRPRSCSQIDTFANLYSSNMCWLLEIFCRKARYCLNIGKILAKYWQI